MEEETNEAEEEEEEESEKSSESDNESGEWITVPKKQKRVEKEEDDDIGEDEGWVTPQNYEKKVAEGMKLTNT